MGIIRGRIAIIAGMAVLSLVGAATSATAAPITPSPPAASATSTTSTTTPAATAPAPSAVPGPTGKYVVVLKDGVSPAQNAAGHGAAPTKVFTQAADGYAATLTPAAQTQLQTDPNVLFVAPDKRVTGQTTFRPHHVTGTGVAAADDGPYPPVTAYPQFIPTNLARVGLGQGLTAPYTQGRGRSINVGIAVLDTGVQVDNPDLNVVGGTNCSDDPTPGYGDVYGHGTFVAGVAAAKDNSFGVVGVAPGAPIYSVRALDADDSGEDSNIICALDWVAAHRNLVKVANMSLGGPEYPNDNACGLRAHDPVHLAVCKVVAGGTTVVAAAGNDSQDITAEDFDPATYPEVIAVSGYADTDGKPGGHGGDDCHDGYPPPGDDQFAYFSNYGQAADIAAVAACAESTYDDGTLVYWEGTSFAAPAVSGAVALQYARNPLTIPLTAQLTLQALADHHPIPGDPRKPNEGLLNLALL